MWVSKTSKYRFHYQVMIIKIVFLRGRLSQRRGYNTFVGNQVKKCIKQNCIENGIVEVFFNKAFFLDTFRFKQLHERYAWGPRNAKNSLSSANSRHIRADNGPRMKNSPYLSRQFLSIAVILPYWMAACFAGIRKQIAEKKAKHVNKQRKFDAKSARDSDYKIFPTGVEDWWRFPVQLVPFIEKLGSIRLFEGL